MKYFETEYNLYGWPILLENKGKNAKTCLKILEVKVECKEAPEPSNIIWENLQDDHVMMLKKKIAIYIFLLLFIIFMIYVFVQFRTYLAQYFKAFPPTLNCDQFDKKEINPVLASLDKASTLIGTGHGIY